MKVAIVGATGLVGRTIAQILEEREFPVKKFIPVASLKSTGSELFFRNTMHKVLPIGQAIKEKPDIAIFSAGKDVSLKYAKEFSKNAGIVIDNSSAWRMDDHIKLIVPEVNGNTLDGSEKIIANPNCSTIQMVVAINPLHQKYKIKRLVISTYQAVSGSGNKALEQMWQERSGEKNLEKFYPYPIDLNCIPHGGNFLENGYTDEEMKLVFETRKILGDNNIAITSTVVRIPVQTSHSESINIEFNNDFEIEEIKHLLSKAPGVKVIDDPASFQYPVPINAAGTDLVYVGRIRRDYSMPKSLNMWVVADNLRKGAATNAVQIAELINRA